MNPTFILPITLLLIAAAFWFFKKPRRVIGEYFANAIVAVNITPKGRCTRIADAAFTSRYLLCKPGSDAAHIAIAGAADIPLGVVPDMTPVSGDLTMPLPVNLLGLNEDTERMVASAAIAVGAFVVPAANGQIATAPGAGAGYALGRAMTAAAAAGDLIEVAATFPVKVAAFPY